MKSKINMKSKVTMELVDKKFLNMSSIDMGKSTCLSVAFATLVIPLLQVLSDLAETTNNSLMIGIGAFLVVVSWLILMSSTVFTHISGWNFKQKEQIISIWWIVNFIPLFLSFALSVALISSLFGTLMPNSPLGGIAVFSLFVFLVTALVTSVAKNGSKYLTENTGAPQYNIPQHQPRKLF